MVHYHQHGQGFWHDHHHYHHHYHHLHLHRLCVSSLQPRAVLRVIGTVHTDTRGMVSERSFEEKSEIRNEAHAARAHTHTHKAGKHTNTRTCYNHTNETYVLISLHRRSQGSKPRPQTAPWLPSACTRTAQHRERFANQTKGVGESSVLHMVVVFKVNCSTGA